MKTIVVFAAFIAISLAAPQRKPAVSAGGDIVIINETPSNNIGVDGYKFAYELSNGSTREESAQIEARGAEEAVLRVIGSYSFVNPADGLTYTVTYIADEKGFQPQGAHLPKLP